MPITRNENEQATVSDDAVMLVKYSPPRLTDYDLELLDCWATRAMGQPAPAPRFAAYLNCVASFERERRAAAEVGEVVEAYMTPLPCPAWSNREVAHALGKITSFALHTWSDETRELFTALQNVIVVECQYRLDPHGPNGTQVDRAWNKD